MKLKQKVASSDSRMQKIGGLWVRAIEEPTFHQQVWGLWVTAETIRKIWGHCDSRTENRWSLEPYIRVTLRVTSIMGVPPPWAVGIMFEFKLTFKGALDKFNIIPNFFPKKVGIFIPLEVLAWVKTAFQVLRSRLTYFWRNMNICSIFYFSKSTSINTQYSSLLGTLKMMLFTKYLVKWKRIGRISWNFGYWVDFKSSIELDIKR